MKLILFTHKIDIDGMGSAVLAKLAFCNPEIVFCDTFEIDKKLNDFFENKKIYEFDKIFITDIFPSLEMLKRIESDEKIKSKLKVLDHHSTDLQKNEFDFVQIKINDKNGKCCGTTLFLKELEDNFHFLATKAVKMFAELTRRYDTWEWKTIYNDNLPNDLNLLFGAVKIQKYISLMSEKLKFDVPFKFTAEELENIEKRKKQILKGCKTLEKKMEIKDFDGFKAGVVHDTVGNFRNEFAEYLKSTNHQIDIMLMINHERGTVSIRSINPDADVRPLVIKFGGKAHKNSGGFPISDEFLKLI